MAGTAAASHASSIINSRPIFSTGTAKRSRKSATSRAAPRYRPPTDCSASQADTAMVCGQAKARNRTAAAFPIAPQVELHPRPCSRFPAAPRNTRTRTSSPTLAETRNSGVSIRCKSRCWNPGHVAGTWFTLWERGSCLLHVAATAAATLAARVPAISRRPAHFSRQDGNGRIDIPLGVVRPNPNRKRFRSGARCGPKHAVHTKAAPAPRCRRTRRHGQSGRTTASNSPLPRPQTTR